MRSMMAAMIILATGSAAADDFSGTGRLWFTLAAMPLQASGSAGQAKGMERFPREAVALRDLRSECFGWADGAGLGKGHCINTAPNGDLWIETYECGTAVPPPAGAFAACKGHTRVLGGTGQFAAMAGSGEILMLTTMIAPDGMQVVYAPADYDLHW